MVFYFIWLFNYIVYKEIYLLYFFEKMRKYILYIWIVLIILILTWFVINKIFENWNNWVNPDDKSIENLQWLESGYQIIESNNTVCNLDTDCETPSEYLIKSDCPYQSKCIQNICTVVCPNFEWNWELIKQAIYDCEVKSAFQAHNLKIQVELKNGKIIQWSEPNIDDIFDIVNEAEDKCWEIIMATE